MFISRYGLTVECHNYLAITFVIGLKILIEIKIGTPAIKNVIAFKNSRLTSRYQFFDLQFLRNDLCPLKIATDMPSISFLTL